MFSLYYAVASSVYPEQQAINREQHGSHKTKPCGHIVFLRPVYLALFLHNCVVFQSYLSNGAWVLRSVENINPAGKKKPLSKFY